MKKLLTAIAIVTSLSALTGCGSGSSSSDPDATSNNNINAAKDFIEDVRTAYNSVQDEGDLKTGLQGFSGEFDGINTLISTDLDTISENLTLAVVAIAEAFDKADGAEQYEADNGYTVMINGDTYSVNEAAGSVVLTATVTKMDITDDETDTDTGEAWSGSANVNLSITSVIISSGDTTLSATGEAKVIDLIGEGSWNSEDDSENETTTLGSASIALSDVQLEYASETAEASFSGDMSFNLEGLTLSSVVEPESEEVSFNADDISLTLNGEIGANNETLGVSLTIAADNSDGSDYRWSNTWTEAYTFDGDSSVTFSEETASSYAKLHVIARVSTDLFDAANNNMAAYVELDAERNEYDLVATTITIDYNDVKTILEADIGLYGKTNSDLTVRNTTGVVATVNALSESDDELAGTLTVNDVQAASIEESDDGLVLIRYSDDTFESLF